MASGKNRETVIREIQAFTARLRDEFPVKKAYLYGSYARDEATEQSDIDVAVVIDLPDGADLVTITARLFRHARSIDVDIEPLCVLWSDYLHHEPASILAEIVRSGIEIT